MTYGYTNGKFTSDGANLQTEYDAVGNPTTYRGKTATWQGRKLTSLGGVTFTYDGSGRRLTKNSESYTYDSSDRVVACGAFEFIYDNTGLVACMYCGARYYYQRDLLGNIIAILDSMGNVVVKYKYDAWGNHKVLDAAGEEITSSSHIGNKNPFRYRGYFYDTETGLYYLQTRYYDPEIGRFLNMDSINYANPETINGLNLYAYCGNNPVMNIDPDGCFILSTICFFIVCMVVIDTTANDIRKIVNEEVTATVSDDGESVIINNSYKIVTPWVQFGYSFYLNHINPETKDVIKGSSIGVQYEWFLHNAAYYVGIERAHTQSVDVGASIFSDSHKGNDMVRAMKVTYFLFVNPIFWPWDLVVNGGFGEW